MENYETCAARGTDHRSDLARSTRLLASCKDISAVIYGCTSGEVLHGRDFIEDAIRDTLSGAFVVTPLAAVVEALEMCSAQTISILSPYGDSLNRKLVELFENNGIAVEQVASPNEWRARDLSAIDILDLTTAASAMEFSRSGALFIPCNALSVVNVIDGIEASIDMTVLTSTQASVWKALQLLDQLGAQSLAKFGSIFSTVETPN
jgi:maleate isomerase